jgi:hypothetical protein
VAPTSKAEAVKAAGVALALLLVLGGGPAVAADPPRPPGTTEQAVKPKPPPVRQCWAMWLGIWQMCLPR